jgi:hypothetical protein
MMENFSKLSFRETLTILIPGIFIMFSITPIISEVFSDNIFFDNSKLNLLLLSISSLFFGIILYVLDVPKKIPFFNNAKPTEQLNKKLIELNINADKPTINNAYYDFYNKCISPDLKGKIDRVTTMYHFSMNIFISSLVVILLYSIYWFLTKSFIFYFFPIILIALLSLISALGLFYSKVLYYFTRAYNSFLNSEEYKNIIE